MDSCERQRRAAITFSVINQSLLPNRSEMSLERVQRLFPQNPGADEPHLTSATLPLPGLGKVCSLTDAKRGVPAYKRTYQALEGFPTYR
jgi:hypothetical protein